MLTRLLPALALLLAACPGGDGGSTDSATSGTSGTGGTDSTTASTGGPGGDPGGPDTSDSITDAQPTTAAPGDPTTGGPTTDASSTTGGIDTSGSGTVTATIDGTTVVFDARQVVYSNDATDTFWISADNPESTVAASLGLAIVSPAPGTFDCTISTLGTLQLRLSADQGGTIFTSWSQADCSIELTEFGDVGEPVRGTFSGTVAVGADPNGEKRTVTTGSFDVIRGDDL